MSGSVDNQVPSALNPQVFCKQCGSPLVQASHWQRYDAEHWQLRLWCPECGFERKAVLAHPEVVRLSLAIEEGFACLLEALAELDSPDTWTCGFDLVKRLESERIRPATS